MIGIILGVDGIFEPIKSRASVSLLNRDWGFCLIVFGGLMTFFGARGQKAQKSAGSESDKADANPPMNG